MRMTLMARRMTSATWLPAVTVSTDLVTDGYVRAELNSGKTWARSRGCPRGRSSSGVESEYAVATPGKAFSAPGPYCMQKTASVRPFFTRA
jgi:hypothetical protein